MAITIEDPDRGTGRTTRRAIAYVGLVLNHPNEKVHIRDHTSANGHVHITRMVSELLTVLNVDHKVDDSECGITVLPRN